MKDETRTNIWFWGSGAIALFAVLGTHYVEKWFGEDWLGSFALLFIFIIWGWGAWIDSSKHIQRGATANQTRGLKTPDE